MSILDKLASSLGQKDEAPNLALALEIADTADTKAVVALVENLNHKNKNIQSDCIKVLYEIGAIAPDLIADYSDNFLALLYHKNNRLQWGTMTALHAIASVKPNEIYENLPLILDAADKGSVITRDNAVNILITLAAFPKYAEDTFVLLLEQLQKSPPNQLPMYAERVLPVIDDKNKEDFVRVLRARLSDIEKESKRKRVEKVIKKVMQM